MATITAVLMRFAFSCLIGTSLFAQPPVPSRIVFVGTFSSDRATEEHRYRSQVDLWRDGQRIFGLRSDVAGQSGDVPVPITTPFDGTWAAASGAVKLSNGFRGMLRIAVLSGSYQGDPAPVQLRKSTDQLQTHPETAPLSTYAEWLVWANEGAYRSVTSQGDFHNRSEDCGKGDGAACRDVAERIENYRPPEAQQYREKACQLNDWKSCRKLGNEARAQEVLLKLCHPGGDSSYELNAACGELGDVAAKNGNPTAAIRWYQMGCNDKDFPDGNCFKIKKLREKGAKK